MTELPAQKTAWHVSQVIELAADLSEVALPWAESGEAISDPKLFEFWEHGRQLTADWLRRIELLETTKKRHVALEYDLLLGTLANEIFSVEVVARLFATTLAALDRVRKTPEYRPIAENALFAIQHVRARLMALVLAGDEQHAPADRFRRRCERWTDLLIGPTLVRFGTAAFTHDARRSWEFGEDLLTDSTATVAQKLVRPSLLTAFRGQAGRSPIQAPAANAFLASMIKMVPAQTMTRQLQRWTEMIGTTDSDPLPSTRSWTKTQGETEGWSLLDRCLGIVEKRRARGE